MPMCSSTPATSDYESGTRTSVITDLDKCLKKFDGAVAATMNSYRELLTAFDHVAQVFGNIAGICDEDVRAPVLEFRDGMRDLRDKGPFVTFNSEVHSGTVSVFEPIRAELKQAQKSLADLKTKQKDYDSVRSRMEKKEKEYAKKDKPLTASTQYQTDSEKRDKAKKDYEAKRTSFNKEVETLQTHTSTVLLKSMNNYLHCTATFCGQLEATMNGYRTDVYDGASPAKRSTKMDKLKEKAEYESNCRRARRSSSAFNSEGVSPALSTLGNKSGDYLQEASKPSSKPSSHAGSPKVPSNNANPLEVYP